MLLVNHEANRSAWALHEHAELPTSRNRTTLRGEQIDLGDEVLQARLMISTICREGLKWSVLKKSSW